MRGGSEEGPCWSEARLERYESITGRPCPYVELEPANGLYADLLPFVLDERLRGFLPGAFQDLTDGVDAVERQGLRWRLAHALNRQDVTDVLYPDLKRMRERSSRGAAPKGRRG